MGTSMSVHVGPFVRVKLEPTTYISNVKCCTNQGCKKHERASIEKFCPDCGTKIETTGVELTGTIGWQEFLPLKDYEYEDELYTPDYLGGEDEEILLSNYAGGSYLDDQGAVLSLSNDLSDRIEIDTNEFNNRHREMLKEMKEFFGNKMTIEYGVCSYWS